MKRLWREPLLQFLLLGALLFIVHAAARREQPGEIRLRSGDLEHLAATFSQIWQRPPTAEEMKGLVDERVKEEILNREAIKLGLDRDDVVIRRRLRQKMEFISAEIAAQRLPSERELEEFLAAHADRFREPARFSFRQVFLRTDRSGSNPESAARELLAALRAGADPETLGDPTLLPAAVEDAPRPRVVATFGEPFAAALDTIGTREWRGPVSSGLGIHLVRVDARTVPRVPTLAEIRPDVERELAHTAREAAQKEFMERLLERYQVVVEWPEVDPGSRAAGAPAQP